MPFGLYNNLPLPQLISGRSGIFLIVIVVIVSSSCSLLDLQFKILRLHSLDESFIASKGLRTLTYSSNKRDRFRDFSIKQSDVRLVFVVSNCVLGNIKPQV